MMRRRVKKAILFIVIILAVAKLVDFAFGYPMAFRVGDWRESLGSKPAGNSVYLYSRLVDEKPSHKSVPAENKAREALEKNSRFNANSPYPASVTLGEEKFRLTNRRVLLAPPPSEIAYSVRIPPRAKLSFGYAVCSEIYRKRYSGARFIVEWRGAGGAVRLFEKEVVNEPAGFWDQNRDRRRIWYRYLRPGFRKWGGGYQDVYLDLSEFEGREGELWFITEKISFEKPSAVSQAVWSNPEVWAERPEGDDPPLNLLVFMIEATPVNLVEPYVKEPAVTPNVRKFAESAVVFDKFFTSGAKTRISTFPFFTGRHYRSMGLPIEMYFLAPLIKARFYQGNYPTLAEAFSREGYRTAHVGSNQFYLPTRGIGLDFGFDEVDVLRRRHYESEDNLHAVMEWLRANGNKPFFLYIHYNGPHNVVENPCLEYMLPALKIRTHDSRWAYRKKLAQEIAADTTFGRVLAALETLGIRDRTVVIMTADHGNCVEPAHSFAVQQSFSRLWYTAFRHGRTSFVEDIHVPLIIDWPVGPDKERHVSIPVTSIDMFSTLIDLILPEPDPEFRERMKGIKGKSLAGLLSDEGGPVFSGHPVIYSISSWAEGIVFDGRYHYLSRDNEFSKILYPGHDRVKVEEQGLFDLETDPRELNNLADSRPDLLSRMQELLEQARPKETMLRLIYMNYEAGKVSGSLGITGELPSMIMTYPEDRTPIYVREKAGVADGKTLEFEFELQGPTGLVLDRPVRWINISINSEQVSEQELRVGPFGLPLFRDSRCGQPGDQVLIESCDDISEAIFLSKHNPMRYMHAPGVYFYTMQFSDFVEETFSDKSLSPAVRSALKQWGYIQ